VFEFGAFEGRRSTWRRRWRTILPSADHENHCDDSNPECHEWKDPGGAIEAGGGGSGEHRGSVFLDESLLYQAVIVAAAEGSHQFVAHAVGSGTADVVTLEQNLVAAADAHQLVADLGEAGRRVARAGKGEDGEREQSAVESAAKDWISFGHGEGICLERELKASLSG